VQIISNLIGIEIETEMVLIFAQDFFLCWGSVKMLILDAGR
jgi:hypothetical protein